MLFDLKSKSYASLEHETIDSNFNLTKSLDLVVSFLSDKLIKRITIYEEKGIHLPRIELFFKKLNFTTVERKIFEIVFVNQTIKFILKHNPNRYDVDYKPIKGLNVVELAEFMNISVIDALSHFTSKSKFIQVNTLSYFIIITAFLILLSIIIIMLFFSYNFDKIIYDYYYL